MKVWLGPSLLSEGRHEGAQWWNAVMLCPECGAAWGRVERGAGWRWSASLALCPEHGDQWQPGGSFLTEIGFGGSSGLLPTTERQIEATLRHCPGLAAYEWKVHREWAERKWV